MLHRSKKIGLFLSLIAFSQGFATDATWTGAENSDLNTAGNWVGDAVPDCTATFDSTYPAVQLNPTANSTFTIAEITFPNSASDFQFTFTAGGLKFTGAGITGTNTNTQITFSNETSKEYSQLYFVSSSEESSIGSAVFSVTNNASGSVNGSTNGGQIIFADFDCSTFEPVSAGDNASITVVNNGIINANNETAQVFLKGSSFTAGNYFTFDAVNAGSGSSIASNSDTGQIVLDAADTNTSFTTGDNAQFSFSNGNSGGSGTISSINSGNNAGQIVFDGKQGNTSFLVGNQASFVFTQTNASAISSVTSGNDAGQMLFDGNNGIASFTAGDNASLTLTSEESSTILGYGFDGGQMVFDGDGGTASFTVGNALTLTIANESGSSIQSSSDGNDAAQMLFDGNGGTVTFVAGSDANLTLTNAGEITSYYNTGQVVFDGDEGTVSFNVGDDSSIDVTNSGSISNLSSGSYAGQIVFDGGSASLSGIFLTTGSNVSITATNSSGGAITNTGAAAPAQMYFNSTTITGGPTLSAINQNSYTGAIEGIIFDGTSTASGANIVLSNSSLVVNTTSAFSIASLTGNASSVVKLSNDLQIITVANATTTFAGTILDESGTNNLFIGGSGTQILSGSNTFTGSTTVGSGAQMILTGSMQGSVVVDAGGKVSGTGSIAGGLTVQSGGVVHPGSSPGILTVSTLDLSPGSIIDIEINAAGQNSEFIVTGAATLGGSINLTQDQGTYARTGQYTILSGSYTQQFDSLVNGGLPGFLFDLVYGSDAVYLNYALYQIPTNGLSGNALTVANYLNDQAAPSTLALFQGLGESEIHSAMNSISPARNAFGTYITQQTSFSLSDLLMRHMDALRIEKQMPSEPGMTTAALLVDASDKIPSSSKHQSTDTPLSFWVSGFGEYAHRKAELQNPSFHYLSEAAIGGFDYTGENKGFAGGALGYAHTHFTEKKSFGHGNINYYFASVYGNVFAGNFYFSPAVWGIFNETKNTRNISFSGFSGKAEANIFAWQLLPHLEVGYDACFSWGNIIPFSSADWVISWQRGYREHGATPFNASAKAESNSMVRSETGLKFCEKWEYSWGACFLKEKISYVFQKPYGTGDVTTALTGIPTDFTVDALTQNLNLGDIGIDFSVAIGKKMPTSISLGYEGEFGSKYWSNQLMLTLKQDF